MAGQSTHYPISTIAARVARRTAYRVVRDPFTIVVAVALLGMWLLAPFGGAPTEVAVTSGAAPDSAEQYLRALRDRDATALVEALSPQARRMLEVRFGMPISGAAAALFREQETRGERVVGWEQVSSYRTIQGDELHFYVVHYARGGERRDVPYVLTVGTDGKVTDVE
jgi:hypothetical protein